jgi:hypothetical protein
MLPLLLQLALIDSARHAMGPEPTRTVRIVAIQHTFQLGNAERAEGPWRTIYARFTALYDAANGKLRLTTQPLSAGFGGQQLAVLSDSVMAGGSAISYEDWIDRINASPERALALAAASPSLRVVGTKQRYGLTFDVVEFPWRNGRMRLELERETHLPDVVEIVRTYPKDFRRAPFGDATVRFEYVDWQIHPGGWWWPMQHKISLNGEPLRDVTIDTVTTSTEPAPADSFAIPDSTRAKYVASLSRAPDAIRVGTTAPPSELAPGILRIPELWAMTVVRQDDGLVIFEAHQSARFLHDVIDTARGRYPGLPIKAVVMTSDPWAHLGGVGEAVALGLPIYVNARSVPFLTSLVKRPAKFVPVRGKLTIGTGANRMELYPVGGPYGERMTMAYFPAHRLLYGADLVFPNQPGPGYDPTSATDLRRAVDREHLAVDSVFCVQRYGPFAWADYAASATSR